MRSRTLLAVVFAVSSFVLPLAAHAAIPFFGPIIPQTGGQASCPASWGMLITVINHVIELLLTLAIVFVAPLTIAYAGFLYVVNPVNPSGIAKAKGILLNTIVGIAIALAGWMIVAAIMAVLYNPTASSGTTVLGTWSSLITSGGIPPCIPLVSSLKQVVPGAGVTTGTVAGAILSFGTGACDASVLQRLVPSLSSSQANTFACLAKPESVCGSVVQNYSWNKATSNGKASTAYGAFQVTLSGNHSSFENQACYTAAGVLGPLNCQKGFGPNGFTAGGDSAVLANCMKAAANLTCNTAAAAYVLQKQGFGAWTTDAKSSVQQACITQYANS